MQKKILCFIVVLLMMLAMASVAMAATVTTAADLISAAAAGGSITLASNINLGSSTVTVPSGVTTVIDLNGYVITGSTSVNTKNTELIHVSKGNLTINDSKGGGKISYEYTGAGDGYRYTHNTITNDQGVLTINGGTIENLTNVSNQISYVIDTRTNGNIGNATTTINGGKISSPYYIATRVFANSTTCTGTLIINGGEFTGRVQMHDANGNANKGVIEISDGTFNANTNDALYIYATGDSSNLSISVSGGDFNGPVRSVNGSGDVIEGFISGGSFSIDPASELIVPGESTVEIDGRWYLGDDIPTQGGTLPETGDNSRIALWSFMMLAVLVYAVIAGKRFVKAR